MKRSQIDNKFKWNIEDIFTSISEFDKLLKSTENQISFSQYAGKLSDVNVLKECFDKLYDVAQNIDKLSVYSMMKKDEDGDNSQAITLYGKVENLCVKFSTEVAFIDPELTSYSSETLNDIVNSPIISRYKLDILKIIEQKPHILSFECENLLAQSGKVLSGYKKVFSMIDNVDLDYPTLKIDGKNVKITSATYSKLLQHPNKNVRKRVFKAYYNAYKKVLNTITAVYSGNVEKDVFLSKIRKFDSCLSKALHAEEVPLAVYNKLIESVNCNLKPLHEYIKVRKSLLKGALNMYDLYVPLIEGAELNLDYLDAYDLVLKGLSPLGEEYLSLLKRARDERWIDVYENDGKRGGAYSVSVYSIKHPYVLLNHTKTTHSVFTIAHELGHALHSYYSNKTQPRETCDYKIFVAEVASTVNEVLLVKYLIANAKSSHEKKYFLSYYLDTLRTTLFRQTMFAEFEQIAHESVEKGTPLTKDYLNEVYLNLNKKYYGKSVVSNDEIMYEWARIPHFYNSFYVYKYATGIISAVAICERILSSEKDALCDYFKFLSSGCSDKPVELLKIAGVDLTTSEPYEMAIKSFEKALTDFKKL